jgi:hypothetical protein
MGAVNFQGKTFVLQHNTENGTTNATTVFKYQQEGNLVTADFMGGSVQYGKIIAIHKGDYLDMIYQMLTSTDELKSGKAIANIIVADDNKIQLHLNWQWLTDSDNKGTSTYIECY